MYNDDDTDDDDGNIYVYICIYIYIICQFQWYIVHHITINTRGSNHYAGLPDGKKVDERGSNNQRVTERNTKQKS